MDNSGSITAAPRYFKRYEQGAWTGEYRDSTREVNDSIDRAYTDGTANERNDVLCFLEAIGEDALAERIANREHKP